MAPAGRAASHWANGTRTRAANCALEVREAVGTGGFLGLDGSGGRRRAAGWPLRVGRSRRVVGEEVDLIHGGGSVDAEMSAAAL